MDAFVGVPPGDVVVGVDGSAVSVGALRWAAPYAQTIGASLRVISAWEALESYVTDEAGISVTFFESRAQRRLDNCLLDALGPYPDVHVSSHVVHGNPARVLVAASATSDLLVLGSRGRGELAGMLMGSVSEYCATHAHCPVVIIRPEAAKRLEARRLTAQRASSPVMH